MGRIYLCGFDIKSHRIADVDVLPIPRCPVCVLCVSSVISVVSLLLKSRDRDDQQAPRQDFADENERNA